MAFKKGHDANRAKGRPKGSLGKRTLVFAEVCEAEEMDFASALVKIAKDTGHEKHFEAVKEGCQYLFPKKQAIAHSGSIDLNVQQELEGLLRLSEEEIVALIKREMK